ncbi:MAG TPA: cofactor-independent phosphoglycerate mutase [Acidimicrobiales bacterium]|nr:cofactor-independent phosphoglycerate mutase [Acidimicrobiales bacterium]
MKYVVCVPDGASDEPLAELGNRTPLEVASLPHLAALAARGEVGRAATIPAGMPPGSDVGNLSILGYDPAQFHTGRAPIEAAAMGLHLEPDQVAYRCNLVTVGDDGTMVDFAGGHPSTDDAGQVIARLQKELGDDEISFHPGVQYRHILIATTSWEDAECVPPHDLTGKPAEWPAGPAAGKLRALMDASRAIVSSSGLAANQVWLWGQGRQPELPAFSDVYGVRAGLVSAVDLVRGLGVLAGIPITTVEGATGWYDTNYEGKRDACLEALAGGTDLFLIHVEASDEAGHAGDVGAKVEALENWDRRILGPLVDGLEKLAPWRLLLLPDHPTPLATRTHTSDPVPYLLVDSASDGPGGVYTEAATAGAPALPGHTLMRRLIVA